MPGDTRFTPEAAQQFRAAIQEAGGIELFAIGRLDADRRIQELEVHCRGQVDAVPALLKRPRPGEVVIHNHPSGVVQASDADMRLAGLYGDDGVGVVITDNAVREALWVVEPLVRERRPVDLDRVRRFFEQDMPRAMPGHEPRGGQVEMALAVSRALNEGEVAVLEAGTGTGKSLAYLLPSVLWTLENEARVVVSTYTITLQGQLATEDLPVLSRAGLDFRFAVLKGRGNYICRRKLAEALAELEGLPEEALPENAALLRSIARFAENALEGSRHDLAFPVDEDSWEQVQSDHDQTLRARCPFYDRCFYYQARRKAADAQLLVVNHHLLLADLLLKGEGGVEGVLPRYDRVVIDEGHHLEDAATSLFHQRLTIRAIRRAIGPMLDRRDGRKGALSQIRERFAGPESPLDIGSREAVSKLVGEAARLLPALSEEARGWMEQVAMDSLPSTHPASGTSSEPLRITPRLAGSEIWTIQVLPTLAEARRRLSEAATVLGRLEAKLEELPPRERARRPQPLFDLSRARRRLGEKAEMLTTFCEDAANAETGHVRWMELARDRFGPAPSAALCLAPIEVGPVLRDKVFAPLEAAAITSATLTVDGRFDHFVDRVGLSLPPEEGTEDGNLALRTGVFPSPFDYRRQALLGVTADFPSPQQSGWTEACARVVVEATRMVKGGVFVLCTSYRVLDALHARARAELGDRMLLLRQGEMGRSLLLERFRDSGNAVLFGTDSFWEGVSVRGDALRLVIIPRLPFRVPTEPVQQARYERIEARGEDPFHAYALPQAVLRLRQGFGRLVRSRTDRGAVLVLDSRIVSRRYGRTFLDSLPPARRVVGPTREVLAELWAFFDAL